MNVLDKVIAYVSPQRAFQRAKNRIKINILNSGYSETGASQRKNSLLDWNASSWGITQDFNENASILRKRSRSLYMSGGLGTAAIKFFKSNVIGAGLKLQPQIDFEALGISEEEAKRWCRDVEKKFHLWAMSKNCDVMGLNNFYELQGVNFASTLLNGDNFTLLSYNKDLELTLHLIEADRISTPTNINNSKRLSDTVLELDDGRFISSGLEITSKNHVVAVYISNTYGCKPSTWKRIPILNKFSGLPNVLHTFESERPEQTRGIPLLANVIEMLKQVNRYIDAELWAAILNSSFVGFVQTDTPTEFSFDMGTQTVEERMNEREQRAKNYKLSPGIIHVLGENESITFADPKRPNSGMDNFIVSVAKLIGATIEIPYEALLKTFNSSYSASRASILEAWKIIRQKRQWIINDFNQPIYETWLFQQVAIGKIKADGFLTDKYKRKLWSEAMWIGSSPTQIDPVKEVDAAIKRVENGFSTRAKEAQELTGTDFLSNAKTLSNENELLGNGGKQGEQIGEVL